MKRLNQKYNGNVESLNSLDRDSASWLSKESEPSSNIMRSNSNLEIIIRESQSEYGTAQQICEVRTRISEAYNKSNNQSSHK